MLRNAHSDDALALNELSKTLDNCFLEKDTLPKDGCGPGSDLGKTRAKDKGVDKEALSPSGPGLHCDALRALEEALSPTPQVKGRRQYWPDVAKSGQKRSKAAKSCQSGQIV